MKLSEIKFVYVTKIFNSYKKLVNEYVFVGFDNKVILKMDEKQFGRFVNRNLDQLILTSAVVDEYNTFVYLVKQNIVKIEKQNNKIVAYLKNNKNFKNLFDFEEFEIEHISNSDLIDFNHDYHQQNVF